MTLDPIESAAFHFILQVERFYASLIADANAEVDGPAEVGLGGKLLYAGELDDDGRALLVAGNIAGAASLAATADVAAQKRAVRDGVADFLVTSLDEALRILKNETRKRETVAVCMAAAPQAVESEMLERGVLPDLLRPADESSEHSPFVRQGALQIQILDLGQKPALLTWRVAAEPAQWLPRLDAVAADCLQAEAWSARRWLRLAPRYLGRLAQDVRLMVCDRDFTEDFIEQVRERVNRAEIGVAVEVQVSAGHTHDQHWFRPNGDSGNAG